MKFQSVFIIFNILLLVFLVILCLAPALLFGSQMISVFWRSNWFLILILALILVCFDVFYFTNRRLYALLEKEDWPALITYLEDRVLRQGKYSPRLVKLLANTYLVLSDSTSVMSLENKAAMARPSLVDNNALVFGTARILGKDISGAAHFFETRLDKVKSDVRSWVRWYYGFSLLLDRRFEEASREFSLLSDSCRDGIISGLSAYFLGAVLAKSVPSQTGTLETASAHGKKRVIDTFPARKNWDHEVSRISTEIHIAVLSKYMEEAGQWLYKENIS